MTRAICLLILLLSGPLAGSAQGIRFEEGDYDQALAKAAKEKKLLMVVVCADWLEACTIMQADIFTLPEVGAAFNARFVSWQLDAKGLEENPYFAGVRVLNIPEFIFFNGRGEAQFRSHKLKDRDEMLALADEAANPENHLDRMAERYAAGHRDPEFVRRYIVEADAVGRDMLPASRDYLARLPRERLTEVPNWIVATIGVQQITEPIFQYILANVTTFRREVGQQPVDDFIVAVYRNSLLSAAERQDAALLRECEAVVRKLLGPEEAQPVILQDQMTYHATGKQWAAYEQAALAFFGRYGSEDAGFLNDAAWLLSQHSTQPGTLVQAEAWARKSVELQPAYWNCHTLAFLLWANHHPDEAAAMAAKALELSEGDDEAAAEAKALLQKIENSR